MGWKEFVANIIGSLAWPGAIAFIVFLLREPLSTVIRALRKVRYRELEADFGEAVEEAEIVAAHAELPAAEPFGGEAALSTELATEIATSPRAAVIEAWIAVEQELESVAEAAGIDQERARGGTFALISALRRRSIIDESLLRVLGELRAARNVAVHARPYTIEPEAVVDYVKLAGRVRSALRERKAELTQGNE